MISSERTPAPGQPRGVSTVVGTLLMVAIVVVLAAVIASMAVGFEDELREPAPSGGFDHDWEPTGQGNTDHRPYVTITHQVGETVDAENIVIQDESGNSITWVDIWTGGPEVKAGEYVHIDGFGSDAVLDPICEAGDRYDVIVQNDADERLIVNTWTAPSDPQLPPSETTIDDGIPDWC